MEAAAAAAAREQQPRKGCSNKQRMMQTIAAACSWQASMVEQVQLRLMRPVREVCVLCPSVGSLIGWSR